MKTLLFSLLFLTACQSNKQPDANALEDLMITHQVWTTSDPDNLFKGTESNRHSFTIKNSSKTFAYRRILVKFRYFDKDHKQIDSTETMVYKTVRPDSLLKVDGIDGTFYKPATKSATVTILKATEE